MSSGLVGQAQVEVRKMMTEVNSGTEVPTTAQALEQWQLEALTALLATEVKEVEPGQRTYTSSAEHGNSRYHILERVYDGVQVEQMETGEKWNKRVNLYSDEVPAVLKTLLTWYLEEVRQRNEAAAGSSSEDDILGDLDAHPF